MHQQAESKGVQSWQEQRTMLPSAFIPLSQDHQNWNHLWSFCSALVRERAEMRQTSRACWWEGAIAVPGIWVLVPHACTTQKSSHSQVVECRWNIFFKSEKKCSFVFPFLEGPLLLGQRRREWPDLSDHCLDTPLCLSRSWRFSH